MGEIRLLAKAGRNKEIRELLEVEDEKIVIDKDSNGKEIGQHVETYKVYPVDGTNAAGRTALIEAASAGHTKTAGLLIDAGADVNAQQAQGYSPLWLASYKGHPEMVKLLLAAGADKAIESSRNKLKAIDVVCQGGNAEHKEKIVAMIKKAKALNVVKQRLKRKGALQKLCKKLTQPCRRKVNRRSFEGDEESDEEEAAEEEEEEAPKKMTKAMMREVRARLLFRLARAWSPRRSPI